MLQSLASLSLLYLQELSSNKNNSAVLYEYILQ